MSGAPHVLFAGGGAAGHLFPGLAVAEHFSQRFPQAKITFTGSGKSRERHIVQSAGRHYTVIPAQPLPRNPLHALRFVTDNVAGYCAARWMLREQQVSLVVGLGGYTSAAVVRAALARDLPVILLEQNAIPGRTTRWLARSAAMVCAAFEQVRPHLHVQAPVTITGNPTRPAFERLYRKKIDNGQWTDGDAATIPFSTESSQRQKRLVILGGADGARSLNESLPAALRQLGDSLASWQIVHQTGEGQLQATERRYQQAGVDALAVTCIDEIASVLFVSDLVVCRAGGTTLAELALAGVPAILAPHPSATDDHQTANAKVIAAAGACRLIDETSQTGALDTALARELRPLVTDDHRRREMGRHMHDLARPRASAEIAEAICNILYGCRSGLAAA